MTSEVFLSTVEKNTGSNEISPECSITRSEFKSWPCRFLGCVTMTLTFPLDLSGPQSPQIGNKANDTLRLLEKPKLKNTNVLTSSIHMGNWEGVALVTADRHQGGGLLTKPQWGGES